MRKVKHNTPPKVGKQRQRGVQGVGRPASVYPKALHTPRAPEGTGRDPMPYNPREFEH